MSLRELTGVETDFVFQPVRLEGEEALVHANRDALRGEFVRVGATLRVQGADQLVQLRRQSFEEPATFETTGAAGAICTCCATILGSVFTSWPAAVKVGVMVINPATVPLLIVA